MLGSRLTQMPNMSEKAGQENIVRRIMLARQYHPEQQYFQLPNSMPISGAKV